MRPDPQQHRDALTAMIDEKFSQDAAHIEVLTSFRWFSSHFFQDFPSADFLAREVADLYGMALSAWQFARAGKAPKIQVYNPDVENHDWQSTHTVINVLSRDLPFLIDSLRMALNARGIAVHTLLHPTLDKEHCKAQDACILLHFEIDRQSDTSVLAEIERDIQRVLHDLQRVVDDWQAMREKLQSMTMQVDAEQAKFLNWLADGHFVLLGYREYRLQDSSDGAQLLRVADSGLGICAGGHGEVSRSFARLSRDLREQAMTASPRLVFSKTSTLAPLHRAVRMDVISIKQLDNNDKVSGEARFLGLYTGQVYHASIMQIPCLATKARKALETANYPMNSHAGRALLNILETYPRDELFQSDPAMLLKHAKGILQAQERKAVKAFVRFDPFRRWVSVMIYLPRENYHTGVRQRIQAILSEFFKGAEADFNTHLSDAPLAQVHFIVHTPRREALDYNHSNLEAELREVIRDWRDALHDALLGKFGEARGIPLYHRYAEAFSLAYQEDFSPRVVVHDIERLESLSAANDLTLSLYHPADALDETLRFKLYHAADHLALSDVLPLLENMGVRVIRERSYTVRTEQALWLQEFTLCPQSLQVDKNDFDALKPLFQEAFHRVWHGDIENDGLNRLVLRAQLDWREITVLRAYCKYLLQAGSQFSRAYMEQALNNNPSVAADLFFLFHSRFEPGLGEAERVKRVELQKNRIADALEAVSSLDEDRILRRFLAVVLATLRTNYFQQGKSYLSFKLDPHRIPDLPEPRPMYEIFVYSPRVEGVHLRGGKVARGGLRWSDRLEDFRTEVLGLVKAQMVKNAVIVPVGSKGGFVVKQPPEDRDAFRAEGIECYKTFIRGLLDLTDNLRDGYVFKPPQVVCYDDDDPYLVVAADKGTASFSDIANSISRAYGFWLDDAFASGGSAGYDHKAMGITARGAWECVKRHFRELGSNIQTTPFSVIGIGSMFGDVFGNGMLLSPQIKLVGAFDHSHIFLDPTPDPTTSFAERQRLFDAARPWPDYNPDLISEGGGLFSRKAKAISLTPQIKALLNVQADSLPPNELIRAMLRAPVDLLWNGGIGTYVKASNERHADAGDRSNDAVRIDAPELRCKVVGEGGNLGLTQLARVEYALRGGKVNTDAMDNSGGVDCSDHEVNIKILLNAAINAQALTFKQRDELLKSMTDDVAAAVLLDNYRQSLAISLSLTPDLLELHGRLIRYLEHAAKLDRQLEFLPTGKTLAERAKAKQGLTRPELCVLLAYAKIDLYGKLLASNVPDSDYLQYVLADYFPPQVRADFSAAIANHSLRREIIATQLTNQVINFAGPEFVFAAQEETGFSAPDCARAFFSAWEIFDLNNLWQALEKLDNHVDAATQHQALLALKKHAVRAARWLLRNRHDLDIQATLQVLRPGIQELRKYLPTLRGEASFAPEPEHKLPPALAEQITLLKPLLAGLDILIVAQTTNTDVTYTANLYFYIGAQLKLSQLHQHAAQLPRDNRWQALSRAAIREELTRNHRALCAVVIKSLPSEGNVPDVAESYALWQETKRHSVEHCLKTLSEINAAKNVDLSMVSVGLQEVQRLVG
jgi:glutamate dehydrogenase